MCFSLGAQKCDFHPVDHQQMFDVLTGTPKWDISEESTARLPCIFWAIWESHEIRVRTLCGLQKHLLSHAQWSRTRVTNQWIQEMFCSGEKHLRRLDSGASAIAMFPPSVWNPQTMPRCLLGHSVIVDMGDQPASMAIASEWHFLTVAVLVKKFKEKV